MVAASKIAEDKEDWKYCFDCIVEEIKFLHQSNKNAILYIKTSDLIKALEVRKEFGGFEITYTPGITGYKIDIKPYKRLKPPSIPPPVRTKGIASVFHYLKHLLTSP